MLRFVTWVCEPSDTWLNWADTSLRNWLIGWDENWRLLQCFQLMLCKEAIWQYPGVYRRAEGKLSSLEVNSLLFSVITMKLYSHFCQKFFLILVLFIWFPHNSLSRGHAALVMFCVNKDLLWFSHNGISRKSCETIFHFFFYRCTNKIV